MANSNSSNYTPWQQNQLIRQAVKTSISHWIGFFILKFLIHLPDRIKLMHHAYAENTVYGHCWQSSVELQFSGRLITVTLCGSYSKCGCKSNRCCWLSSLPCCCELEISLLKLITREYKPMRGRPPTTYHIENLKLCHVRWWFEWTSFYARTHKIVSSERKHEWMKDETNLNRRTFRAVILNLCALELAATTSQTMLE